MSGRASDQHRASNLPRSTFLIARSQSSNSPRRLLRSLGFWSLAALVVGLALGIYGFESGSPWVAGLARTLQPLGALWLNALQMAVLPLVVLQLLTAITANGDGASVGSAGRRTIILVFIMLFAAGFSAYFLTLPFISLFSVSPETVEAIRASVLVPSGVQVSQSASPTSLGDWIVNLVPSNMLEAAARGDLLQILIVTVAFGLAVNRLPEKQKKPLAGLFRAGSDAIMILIRWILVATPVGVLALVIGLAMGTGAEAVGVLGSYFLLNQGVLLFFVLLLYPLTALLGGISIRRFARAAARPQLIGMSTRSSVASMPAQIENGVEYLGFSPTTSGFVVPLLVAIFKIQTPIQNSVRVLFLAHIFGVPLSFPQFISFSFAIMVISLTTLGVPGGGVRLKTLPAYVAAGVPVEGMVLMQAIQDLADYVYTLTNTTGQLAAATILSRADRKTKGAFPE